MLRRKLNRILAVDLKIPAGFELISDKVQCNGVFGVNTWDKMRVLTDLRRHINPPFEIGGTGRLLPMEGIRGVAVGLVFMQHYCAQFSAYNHNSGLTQAIIRTFEVFGNFGVELFFVLSGFLIYSMVLRKRPSIIPFMTRRAQRLYPAFVVALLIGAAIDPFRPAPKIPNDIFHGMVYFIENLLFIPGLFPVVPLFAVNWSLSYEWWFYAVVAVAFFCGAGNIGVHWRLAGIVSIICTLLVLSAAGLPYVPIRGLSLLAGMLLAEASARHRLSGALAWVGVALLSGFTACLSLQLPAWLCALWVSCAFYLVSAGAIGGDCIWSRIFSIKYLRWFGNISYSYYLVHGFVVVIVMQFIGKIGVGAGNAVFWLMLVPTFMASLSAGAVLFLFVEKPLSLREKPRTENEMGMSGLHGALVPDR